jgi:hypothetical protein
MHLKTSEQLSSEDPLNRRAVDQMLIDHDGDPHPTTPLRSHSTPRIVNATSPALIAAARLQASPPALQEVGRLPRVLGTHGSSGSGRIR